MKAKTIVPLAIGLGIGVMAIRMGKDMMNRAAGSQGATQTVVVSVAEIEAASKIAAPMLTTTKMPAALVPHNAFVDPKAVTDRVSASMIPAGVLITEAMLAPPGTQPGLSSRIPDGFRAVGVRVDEASSVGGFITPGSYVDVSAVWTERVENQDRTNSRIILQNVRVGAVGQSLNSTGPDGKSAQLSRSVTLLVKPEDVPKLQMAALKGSIQIALRNGRHDNTTDWSGAADKARDLLAAMKPRPQKKPKPPAIPAAPPKVSVVEVYRGTQTAERLLFAADGSALGGFADAGPPGATMVPPAPANGPVEDVKVPEVAE